MKEPTENNQERPGLYIGIDWASEKHDCYIVDQDGKGQHQELKHSPESIDAWVAKMLELSGGKPIAIMLELSRGPLIYALMFRKNVQLYPVNPKQLSSYRESYPGSESKDDPTDARYLARMLVERFSTLTALEPDDDHTRLLSQLCFQRRRVVNAQTKLRQQLKDLLKSYFPLVLELWGGESKFSLLLNALRRWSDPREFKRADRRLLQRLLRENSIRNEKEQTEIIERIRSAKLLSNDDALITPMAKYVALLVQQIEQSRDCVRQFDKAIQDAMEKHPDAHLFTELRGAGKALAPRLLCAMAHAERWPDADALAAFSGIAPVTRQSGKQRLTVRRFACPKYLKQTFHEFADSARKFCPWSKARYRMLRDRGMKHHAALRKIARSWIRILFKIWKTKTPFDYERYIENLKKRDPRIIPYLNPAKS